MKKNVLITGGSGLVGSHLTQLLIQNGYSVSHLGRGKKADKYGIHSFEWDPARGYMQPGALDQADIIVHLAGAGVADEKWTAARKKLIIDSRVQSAQLLVSEMQKTGKKPEAFISASAIGWYGMVTGERICPETDAPHHDFFGECCKLWEESVNPVAAMNIRVVKLRIGIVLARESGFLPKVAAPVRWLAGSPLGSGKQWVPWIHVADLCQMFLQAIEQPSMQGVFNAAGPQHLTNKEITKAIGKALHRPVFLPAVPAFALKLALGEMAQMIVNGTRISNEKILATGFKYRFPTIETALADLLG
ncbi:MAG: TIGR01777 family oxidoreductase [Bacteroidia bacterium]|nr:TIGR01777 family oxidoreductase [Bacteroidia bacterium]